MRKIIIAALLLLVAAAPLMAQVGIEKSETFDEPDFGWNKLLQLKSGSTFYFHSTKKDGFEVMVYDKKRKLISTKEVTSQLWDEKKMKASSIVGLYEINGQPVLFLVQADDGKPTLYRMQLNPNTGDLVKEDVLGNLPKGSASYFAAMASAWSNWGGMNKKGGLEMSDIIIEKDNTSDCYMVIYFNSFAHDRSERIRVVHYNGGHKELSSAFYQSPNDQFKYLRYIGAVVDGDKQVFVATYGHNGKSDDVASRVIVSKLKAGQTEFTHNLLNFSEDFNDTRSVMLYNRHNNKLQLLTLSYLESKKPVFSNKTTSFYQSSLSYLDPESLALLNKEDLTGRMINDYGKKNIDNDYAFHGLPQNMIINEDNTTTVLYEESRVETQTNQYGATVSEKTFLGPIGISELTDKGAELHGYAINKNQMAKGRFPSLYISRRAKGRFTWPVASVWGQNNQFFSYDYVNSSKGRYVIFNDTPNNFDKDEDDTKRKAIASATASNATCYKLGDGKLDKFYLFGEPDSKKSSTFCYIESSDYNTATNTYATLIVERDGRSKEARIAWVTF